MGRSDITLSERSVLDGQVFTSSLLDAALADDGTLEVLIITPAGGTITLRALGVVSGIGEIELFEGTTVSGNGSGLTEVNHNRVGTPKVTTCTVFSGPTITLDGTLLHHDFIPAAGSGLITGIDPFVLEQATNYLLRVTNLSGGAAHTSLTVDLIDSNL